MPTLQADTSNNLLRRVDLVTGLVTTLAGSPTQSAGHADGLGSLATFNYPLCVAMDGAGSIAIVVRRAEVKSSKTSLQTHSVIVI